jgi:hypothetical protein
VTVAGRAWDLTPDFGLRPLRISGARCWRGESVLHPRDERQPRLKHGGHRNLIQSL